MKESTVICFGRDESLLMTRKLLLQREGLRVVAVADTEELCTALRLHSVDVIIFCQSISQSDFEAGLRCRQTDCPSARCIVVFAGQPRFVPGPADTVFDAVKGPVAFLQTVRHTLSAQPA